MVSDCTVWLAQRRTKQDPQVLGQIKNLSARMQPQAGPSRVEWPTFALFLGTYAALLVSIFLLPKLSILLAVCTLSIALALHSSLTHELLHGHPFRNRHLNDALAIVQPSLLFPYYRFRDTHLAHHQDANLTDPYDDPETNYFDPAIWATLPAWARRVLRINNTLIGRITLGTAIGAFYFLRSDLRAMRAGERAVITAWAIHIPTVVLTLWVVSLSALPVWAYLIGCYMGLSLIRIRTFLEHQAHEKCSGRTVIIEDNGPLAWLFLYNSLHVVHHAHPRLAWYKLPAQYKRHKDKYRARNDGYIYASYMDILRRYLFKAKDPLPHPLWSSRQ